MGSTIAFSGGEDETSGVEVSKSTGGCSLTTGVERSGSATGVESNESVPTSSTDSDFFSSQGGVRGPSSSTVSKVPALIFVDPPSAFSPKNEDIWT